MRFFSTLVTLLTKPIDSSIEKIKSFEKGKGFFNKNTLAFSLTLFTAFMKHLRNMLVARRSLRQLLCLDRFSTKPLLFFLTLPLYLLKIFFLSLLFWQKLFFRTCLTALITPLTVFLGYLSIIAVRDFLLNSSRTQSSFSESPFQAVSRLQYRLKKMFQYHASVFLLTIILSTFLGDHEVFLFSMIYFMPSLLTSFLSYLKESLLNIAHSCDSLLDQHIANTYSLKRPSSSTELFFSQPQESYHEFFPEDPHNFLEEGKRINDQRRRDNYRL